MHCHKRLIKESPEDELFQAYAQMNAVHLRGLVYYRAETEKCLEPVDCRRCKGGPCKTIGCVKLRIPGNPTVASSQFSNGERTMVRGHTAFETHINPVANCGITVVPIKTGHTVLFHYFKGEGQIIESELDHLARLKGKRLEAYISALVLSGCEEIAIKPSFWDGLGKRRQDAMRTRFQVDMPDIGVGTQEMIEKWTAERIRSDKILRIPNPKQINLFRATKL